MISGRSKSRHRWKKIVHESIHFEPNWHMQEYSLYHFYVFWYVFQISIIKYFSKCGGWEGVQSRFFVVNKMSTISLINEMICGHGDTILGLIRWNLHKIQISELFMLLYKSHSFPSKNSRKYTNKPLYIHAVS